MLNKSKHLYHYREQKEKNQLKNSVFRKISDKLKEQLFSERNSVQKVLFTLYFISFAGKKFITASNETIADHFDYCTKTVSRAIKRLVELKMLKVQSKIKYSHIEHKPITLRKMYLTRRAKKLFRIREYFHEFRAMSHKSINIKQVYINRKSKDQRIIEKKLKYNTYDELIEDNSMGSEELSSCLKQYLKVLCSRGKYITNRELLAKIESLKALVAKSVDKVKDAIEIVTRSIANHWTKFFNLKPLGLNKPKWKILPRGQYEYDKKFDISEYESANEPASKEFVREQISQARKRLLGVNKAEMEKTEKAKAELLIKLGIDPGECQGL